MASTGTEIASDLQPVETSSFSSNQVDTNTTVTSSSDSESLSDKKTNKKNRFVCGVVEGFYGRPWTTEKRRELFKRMESMELNTYVYAPKDDLKHRAYWRELYTPEEAEHLQCLIDTAKSHGVNFVYALSPGIDIVYSNAKEVNLIKQKLEQVRNLGCSSFALLFDDIEPSMSEADKDKFTSFAHAQLTVTNEVFECLNQPEFFFCPTEYCESRAVPSLEDSEYLNLLGKKLLPKIHILWTGPRVISRLISVEHARRVAKVLRRPCTIWDNLHANDYDNRRVFLGPYMGRPTQLKKEISGVITNPNCECEANFVAIHTLANWSRCDADAKVENESDATLEAGGLESVAEEVTRRARPVQLYHPLKALNEALDAWVKEFSSPRSAVGAFLVPKPPSSLMIGINTCGSTTSTTSSNSSLCGPSVAVSTAGNNPSSVPMPPGYPAMSNSGPVYTAPGSSTASSPSGPLPLYTPPAVVEALRNPFVPPPLVEEAGSEAPAGLDPLLTPAMQAVNSLTDEYSEPMELALGSGGGSSPVLPRPSVPSTKESVCHLKRPHSDGAEEATEIESVKESSEMMEAKSFDDLTQLDEKKPETEDMIVETGGEGKEPGSHTDEMQVDRDEGLGDETQGSEKQEPFRREDLQLLADLFYLPFEHGTKGEWILEQYSWLRGNARVVRQSKETGNSEMSKEWLRRAEAFRELCDWIGKLFLRVAGCPNRGLVYDLYPYIWDVQSVVSLLNTYVQWLGLGQLRVEPESDPSQEEGLRETSSTLSPQRKNSDKLEESVFPSELVFLPPPNAYEPWVYRGGLVGGLQKLLPLEAGQDLFACRPPYPPIPQAFSVRNATNSDTAAIYELCKKTFDDNLDSSERFRMYPDIIGDRCAGSFLCHSLESCFVMEVIDEDFIPDSTTRRIIGCALAALDAQDFYGFLSNEYLKKMVEKYPLIPSPDAGKTDNGEGETDQDSTSDRSGPCLLTEQDLLKSFHAGKAGVPESIYHRHPSLVHMRCLPDFLNTSAPKRLAAALLSVLKTNGSHGAYCEVRASEKKIMDFYSGLGFYEITVVEDENSPFSSDVGCLGRIL